MGKPRELLFYVLAAIGVSAALVLLAGLAARAWYTFVCFTVLLAVILAKMYWPVRREWKVWLLLAMFMAVHTAGYVVFLLKVHGLPGYWYWLTCPVEIVMFAAIAWHWLKVNPPISGRL